MDVLATVITVLGGLMGPSGFIISVRADRRATRADKRGGGRPAGDLGRRGRHTRKTTGTVE